VNVAKKMMDRSSVTAEGIAKIIYEDSNNGKHAIIPHRREGILWKPKRYFPSIDYIFMKKLVPKMVNA